MRVGGQTQARLATQISSHQLVSSFGRGFSRLFVFNIRQLEFFCISRITRSRDEIPYEMHKKSIPA